MLLRRIHNYIRITMKEFNDYYILVNKKSVLVGWDKYLEWLNKDPRATKLWNTSVGEGRVSTIFLGMDHSYAFEEPTVPILFETMVFDTGTELDEAQERYSTYDEAYAGHNLMIERVKELLNKEK